MSYANINNVVLTGRLTSDPDLHVLPSGNNVCRLRVAVNARRRNPAGEWTEKPNYFDVVVFGPPGETAAKHLHKGRPVAIDGRLDWRKWETADGRNATSVSIIARSVQFLESSSNGSNGAAADSSVVALESIAGSEEEALDVEDQDAIAAVAAA